MKYELSGTSFKKGIIFLSGRGKKYTTWNVTENGKYIGLEEMFRKRCNTCLVEFDPEDDIYYNKHFETENIADIPKLLDERTVLDPLIAILDPNVKWFVVTHSYGSYFASLLPKSLIHGMVLIDPVSTNLLMFKFTIPIVVHLNILPNNTDRICDWTTVTNYHNKSAIIVHYDIGHMIHWSQPGKIQHSIENIL